MDSNPAPVTPRPHPDLPWLPAGGMGDLDAPAVDSETAALFRASLRPVITRSASWPALLDGLRSKGYGLAFRDGRLFLTNYHTGARVCSLRFLGMSLTDLVDRLGRPSVRALPGRKADGELLCAPPIARKA